MFVSAKSGCHLKSFTDSLSFFFMEHNRKNWVIFCLLFSMKLQKFTITYTIIVIQFKFSSVFQVFEVICYEQTTESVSRSVWFVNKSIRTGSYDSWTNQSDCFCELDHWIMFTFLMNVKASWCFFEWTIPLTCSWTITFCVCVLSVCKYVCVCTCVSVSLTNSDFLKS